MTEGIYEFPNNNTTEEEALIEALINQFASTK